ncbi:Radical SAM domain protein [Dissulfuribacter thermophilus]|uniref:Radical SAM domain protein n=1 Tax=Dissulfuribacter thermophilus TaxID=1156395 RepID=A0A1B9F692_9BACT|nr:B12-binding domain-containing radical SAM protein [Dissulfuribacter thermophilus]OCC15354.1 Radical SAM domain protein [Dissulfuribacter thermophilus]
MKALLINPWIYDFAAYNFWIRPLGLYSVGEWLWERGVNVTLVDALSPFKAPGKFKRTKIPTPDVLQGIPRQYSRYGISVDEFVYRIKSNSPFDVVFVTSSMSYWYPGVQKAISLVKELFPHIPVVLGGVYATLWYDHANTKTGADLVLRGPIEKNEQQLSLFLNIPLRRVRKKRPWYLLGLHDGVPYAGIRTATGCPFRCTYCGSFEISGPYAPKKCEEVIDELTYLYKEGVGEIAFYDDALLVDFESRLGPILEGILERSLHFKFHTPNGLHARYLNKKVARYMKKAGFQTIRLSLETTSIARQKATGGKVSNEAVVEAVKNLLDAGIDKDAIGIYLLVGLPGQDSDEVRASIEFVKSLGVRPYLAEFSPIPGTIEWQKLVEMRVIPRDLDPLLTNNTVFFRLYSQIGEEDWKDFTARRMNL